YAAPSPPLNFGVRIVPEKMVFIVERLGKYERTLEPGMHFLIPFVDKIAYVHSLKEHVIHIPNQLVVTNDNVSIFIDAAIFFRYVFNLMLASYAIENSIVEIIQFAKTTLQSEIGKVTLDQTFDERVKLNEKITKVVNEAAYNWGLRCLRCETKDISLPEGVLAAMDKLVEAKYNKRASILVSEGIRKCMPGSSVISYFPSLSTMNTIFSATIRTPKFKGDDGAA
nr:hypothetical protein [Tanacetum cinerariifolium]